MVKELNALITLDIKDLGNEDPKRQAFYKELESLGLKKIDGITTSWQFSRPWGAFQTEDPEKNFSTLIEAFIKTAKDKSDIEVVTYSYHIGLQRVVWNKI